MAAHEVSPRAYAPMPSSSTVCFSLGSWQQEIDNNFKKEHDSFKFKGKHILREISVIFISLSYCHNISNGVYCTRIIKIVSCIETVDINSFFVAFFREME